eukprot:CAMPEP_0117664138 /NCGR_PEP_ID=MMETSP0804-20121206/9036_1 /TAXON_ID=1074897 /ORGANISM="Tetraselmis astigmatica, Strain CCMP880" /LENGTH=610 /DNA_ID=CAMNT_0005471303 /DNA_START=119 /DNA_END=1952 /DNA_ORIENTATION=+
MSPDSKILLIAAVCLACVPFLATAAPNIERDVLCERCANETTFSETCAACSFETTLFVSSTDGNMFSPVGEEKQDLKSQPELQAKDASSSESEDSSAEAESDSSSSKRSTSRGGSRSNLGCSGFSTRPSVPSSAESALGSKRSQAMSHLRSAKRYDSRTDILLMGDSITHHLRDRSCERKLFSDYRGRGLNTGISGMTSTGNLALADWIFSESDMAPKMVWLAIGINDCRRGHSKSTIVSNIIKTIQIVKYYSPQTAVMWQKILPAADDEEGWSGDEWSKQDTYDCVEGVNKEVEKWVKDHESMCMKVVNFESFILSNGRFRDGIYGDGLHFTDGGELSSYCSKIAGQVDEYQNNDVQKRSSELEAWRDVEPIHFEEEGEVYFRWNYSEWTECTGECGTQRRYAECHRFDPNQNGTASEVVTDKLCHDVFLNPLERICGMTHECVEKLPMPPNALVHQPGTLVVTFPTQGPVTVTVDKAEPADCSNLAPSQPVGLLATVIALGLVLIATAGFAAYQACKLAAMRETPPSPEPEAASVKQQQCDVPSQEYHLARSAQSSRGQIASTFSFASTFLTLAAALTSAGVKLACKGTCEAAPIVNWGENLDQPDGS